MTNVERIEGLSSHAVNELRQKHGFNEVKTKPTPAWKKLFRRYTDWVSIIIVCASELQCSLPARHLVSDIETSHVTVQIVAAIVSAAVPNGGGRGWTIFVLLIVELNLVCIVGWSSERNVGNAVKELGVILNFRLSPDISLH